MSAAVSLGRRRVLCAGEFAAPRRARRLAEIALLYVSATGALAFARGLTPENLYYRPGETVILLVAIALAFSIALMGWVVRSARIRIDASGVRWGWDAAGFLFSASRISLCRQYRDAVAVVGRRGSTWYLSARDWAPFDALCLAVKDGGLATEIHDRRAPLWARLQAYGLTLDLLLIFSILLATFIVVMA